MYLYTPEDNDAVIEALQTLDLTEAENMDLREVIVTREREISDQRETIFKQARKINEQKSTIQILIGTTITIITGIVLMLVLGG